MSGNPFDDPRVTAMGLFAEAYAGLNARFAAQFADHGLSPVEFEVLIRLARSPGRRLRMTDLAAQTRLSTSGVTRVVDRMERDGTVCRSACPTDRRSSFTVITELGLAKLGKMFPEHIELIERWFTGLLSPEQLDGFLRGLRIIRDAVTPEATSGAYAPLPAEPPAEPQLRRN